MMSPMMSPMNGQFAMPMNGAMIPLNGQSVFNQLLGSIPNSAYFGLVQQPTASGPLNPLSGSAPAKAVVAAANAPVTDSTNPFLSASSVLNPQLFPPANPETHSSVGNALTAPFVPMMSSGRNRNMRVTNRKHLVQELKRLVDGVSLGSIP